MTLYPNAPRPAQSPARPAVSCAKGGLARRLAALSKGWLGLAAVGALAVGAPYAGLAAKSGTPNAGAAADSLPPLPDQSDPWLYRGSDIPHDKDWYFGSLANGLRYAVRANQVPPGQVSIRIRVDAGSIHERRGEEGFAHLIEHLVFRQSRYLGQAEAIPAWQLLGAAFGTDTNAETTATQTVFKIDLPNATPQSLERSFKLLSGMVIAPNLSESDIRTEAPIVLSEKRDSGGAAARMLEATRWLIAAGQPMADHATIGTVDSIENAHQNAVRAFHARWYRPENVTIAVAGDADPRLMAKLVGKWFGDWPTPGAHTPQPPFGEPVMPAGADPANPLAGVRIMVEPNRARSLFFAYARPWREKQDTVVYNQGLMIDQLALAIINRRLERRSRSGAAFLSAGVDQQNQSRSVDTTFVNLTPVEGKWAQALAQVRGTIEDARQNPPSTEEIAREAAEINVIFESEMQQRSLQPGAKLSDELVNAVDIHETVASPTAVLALFRKSMPLFTPQAVMEHTQRLFAGATLRALYVTPNPAEASEAQLRAAMLAPAPADATGRGDGKPIAFETLPSLGQPAPMPETRRTGLLGIEDLRFANGVTAQIWPTRDDPGRVTVKVRFGAGYRAIAPADFAYASLGNAALVASGEGPLGQDELERIGTGRKLGFDFRMDDGAFQFAAETRAEDLANQLYLFAAKFAQPRWDAAPLLHAIDAGKATLPGLASSPQGVLNRDLRQAQHGGDRRYATPSPADLAAATPEGFRRVWEPILQQGPIEVQIYGDFDRAKGLAALARSFGALANRPPLPASVLAVPLRNADPLAKPVVLRHAGDANQAAAVISWPTSGGVERVSESRELEVLAQVLANRLLDALREKAGAAYAPQVGSDWPLDLPSGGAMTAMVQTSPEMVPAFFTAVDAITADLAAKPISSGELELVIEPLRQQINRASSSPAFFMDQVAGGTQEPARYTKLRSLMNDYTRVSPERLQQLAQTYLVAQRGWRLAVLPEAGAIDKKAPPPRN